MSTSSSSIPQFPFLLACSQDTCVARRELYKWLHKLLPFCVKLDGFSQPWEIKPGQGWPHLNFQTFFKLLYFEWYSFAPTVDISAWSLHIHNTLLKPDNNCWCAPPQPFLESFSFPGQKSEYIWMRGVMGFSFMELRDLGEIDFYSIFSLLCWTESKMLRAVSLCFYFLQIEIWKFSLRPPFFLHIDFCPPWKNVSMGPSKLSYPGKKSSAHNNRICLKLC